MFRSTLIIFGLLLTVFASAQRLNHVQGEVIIQLRPEVSNPSSILKKYATYKGRNSKVATKKCLSEAMNIWQLKFDFATIHEGKFLAELRKDKAVYTAQFNHLLSPRATPNDPNFNLQWQYINSIAQGGNPEADLDADLAWDITTGGVTINGDTIVLAALDDGVDLNHEDWEDNLWTNHGEIPNNGIDDDENGFIDDVNGWNPVFNSGSIGNGAIHGTPVMGIMGAKGNNGIGVAGVNWDVKVLMVKIDLKTDEATLIAGYGYPLALRKLYNESNGERGAFVVATNTSFGIDNLMAEDAPIWCGLFDSLGTVGILNCGATINANINVDIEGDVPTTCPSDFLIGVTSLNMVGEKDFQAGFGMKNIDLGAFGEDAYTLKRNNDYGTFSGTSSATPQVTGAIGLLYSAPCANFGNLFKEDPEAAALLMRKYILEGVKPNELLDTLTATGGQLNLNNSIQLMMQECGACVLPFGVEVSEIIDVAAVINWTTFNEGATNTIRFRQQGENNWTTLNNVTSPYRLTSLVACTAYEFQIKSDCEDESSGYSKTYTFTSNGCCVPPENINVIASNQGLRIEWDPVFAAQRYEVSFKEVGQDIPEIFQITANDIEFTDLSSCTNFEFQVRTLCSGANQDSFIRTSFSPLQILTTNGCGSCTEVTYCSSKATQNSEWISLVKLNTLNNETGSENGYGDYTGMSTNLTTLEEYELTLNISYPGVPFDDNIQAWIDFNQDGIFDEETENIIDLEEDLTFEYTGKFMVPLDAVPGLTRLRIAIKGRSFNDDSKPRPCDNFSFGEVEDYCVEIIQSVVPCLIPDALTLLEEPTMDQATITWADNPGIDNYQYRYRIQDAPDWIIATTETSNAITLNNLESCSTYEFQIQSLCDTLMSNYSEIIVFNTACDCMAPLNVRQVDTLDNAIRVIWDAVENASRYEVSFNETTTGLTIIQAVSSSQTVATALDNCTSYEVGVKAFCLGTDGMLSEGITASTACEVAVTDLPSEVESLSVFPNPFNTQLSVEIDVIEATNLVLKLYDTTGKLVANRAAFNASHGMTFINFEIGNIPAGIYLLGIETEKGKTVRRVVKF